MSGILSFPKCEVLLTIRRGKNYRGVRFSSVTQSCLTLCDLIDCSTPGFPVLHHLLDCAQTHVPWVGDALQPSHPLLSPFLSCLQSCPASGSFPVSQFFTSGGQSIGVSASASVLPMNVQDWFPLGLTGWISLQSKQFKSINYSALSFLYGPTLNVHARLLEKP